MKKKASSCESCSRYVGPCCDWRGGHICHPRPDIERHIGDPYMARQICAYYEPKIEVDTPEESEPDSTHETDT